MSVGANRRADRANRYILVVLAILLMAAGGLVAAAGWGAFTDRSSDVILSASARSNLEDWSWLGWLVGVVLAGAVLALSVRWLWFELRPHPAEPELVIDVDDDLRVRLDPSAWLDAVLADARSLSGVVDARGRADLDEQVKVTLLLSARDWVVPRALVDELDSYLRKRAEHSLERPVDLDVELDLVAEAPPSRVA
ncbi:MAG: hypothetical protein ACXWA3_10390 [Acidimicrobiales bacterium]